MVARTSWLAVAISLAGCARGGDSAPVATPIPGHLLTTAVGDYPHPVDVYETAGATRAVVLLHGGGGTKSGIAYQVGLNADASATEPSTINWSWLDGNRVMLVVPQGQHLSSEPNGTTWSNYAMSSGRDDTAFLQALAAKIRGEHGIPKVALVGHSMGGVMANRMWCESPSTFDAYVSLAGAASSTFNEPDTPCAPGDAARPYMGIIGDSDNVLRTDGAWEAATWTVNPIWVRASESAWINDVLIGEFRQQQNRTSTTCAGALAPDAFISSGHVDTWTSCDGRLVLKRVRGAEHGVGSIEERMGSSSDMDVMDAVMEFVSGF